MNNQRIKNAFTVDVEDYFQVAAFDSVIDRRDWDIIEPRVTQNTEKILEVLADYGVKATFFVLGWIAERHSSLVRKISDEGHEVGCHGYSHQKIYSQNLAEFRQETRRAKAILEDATGRPVTGYRSASFSITKDSLWALDVLAEEGFLYDSSIFPVHHDNYGIPGAGRTIGKIETPSGFSIIEMPLNTVPMLGVNLPIGGGGYFRLYPYAVTKTGLNMLNRRKEPVVFYMHPWELDPEQPRIKANWRSRFRHYNNLQKFESRIRRLLADFDFTTCEAVLREHGFELADCGALEV